MEQRVRVCGGFITVPAPFRSLADGYIKHYKIKVPKKSKLAAKKVTAEKFCEELADTFNDDYECNGVECFSRSSWYIKRGYMFLSVRSDVSC